MSFRRTGELMVIEVKECSWTDTSHSPALPSNHRPQRRAAHHLPLLPHRARILSFTSTMTRDATLLFQYVSTYYRISFTMYKYVSSQQTPGGGPPSRDFWTPHLSSTSDSSGEDFVYLFDPLTRPQRHMGNKGCERCCPHAQLSINPSSRKPLIDVFSVCGTVLLLLLLCTSTHKYSIMTFIVYICIYIVYITADESSIPHGIKMGAGPLENVLTNFRSLKKSTEGNGERFGGGFDVSGGNLLKVK